MAKGILDIVNEAVAKSWQRVALIVEEDISMFPEELWDSNIVKLSISRSHHHTHGFELHTLGSENYFGHFNKENGNIYHKVKESPLNIIPYLAKLRKLESIQICLWGRGVSGNLKYLPEGITKLKKLRDLNLSGNSFTQFPLEITKISTLIQLDISGNKITTLPKEIENLKCLSKLKLSSNQLERFPPAILQLENLSRLDISYNLLTVLPPSIRVLKNLEDINLSNNRLSSLPDELGQLPKLRRLSLANDESEKIFADVSVKNLSKNCITELPLEFSKLVGLELLDLRGNPLTAIPPEILEKATEPRVILSYYFDHRLKKPLHEVKLLIVGQGSVGKTSLVQRILYDKFNPGETKTDGIIISQWQIVENKKQEFDSKKSTKQTQKADSHFLIQNGKSYPSPIRLNIWDFGGQEIMHATHQFFLTKRSLYILVLDSRLTQEENRVEYWLKIIQSFGSESPVLIVGNKTDQHPLDIDRTGLRNKYPNIVGISETSAATGTGIPDLRIAIAAQVNNLPHVHDLLPETWFAIKTRLESLGRDKNYINHDEYQRLCVENDVADDLSQHTLLGFLHDLGVILHFQDDPRLESLGILNPQWVTNGVYKILNSHQLFQKKGVLTLSMLNEILSLSEYPRDKRLFIVDMMRRFELCYDIESNQTFLVPDLLPKDEPYTGEWTGALAFQYDYNVLPTSIISRFIVRMNAFIHKTVWRSGVVLTSGGNTALIKADNEERKIYIWVSGDAPTRRDFLSAIRSQFDSIHRTIAKIETREKVPVPDDPTVVVDYKHLLKLERKGVVDFIPEGLDDPITVRELLDGVATPEDRQRDLMGSRHIEQETVSMRKNLPPATINSRIASTEKKFLFRRISTVIFVGLPHILGRAILDLFGRDKAANSTSAILGYTVVVVGILLIWGIVDLNTVVNTLKDTLRFFKSSS